MGIVDADQIKILFPIGTLFIQGLVTKTNSDPKNVAVGVNAGVLQVPAVFVSGNRTKTERVSFDGVKEGSCFTRFESSFDQVAHAAL
jgi:hypothetical protein